MDFKPDFVPRVVFPKSVIWHLTFSHMYIAEKNFPDCKLYPYLSLEMFEDRLPVVRYNDGVDKFVWELIEINEETGECTGVWPD